MMRKIKYIFIIFLNLSICSAHADQVFFIDGSDKKGLVIAEYDDRILFSTFEGEKLFKKDIIDEIFFDEPQYNYVYLAHKMIDEASYDAAYNLFQKALFVDSMFYPALSGIGLTNDLQLKSKNKILTDSLSYETQLGFSCNIVKNDYVVRRSSYESSDPEKAPLIVVGDTISKIWGYPTKFMEEKKFNHFLVGIPGSEVKLSIKRKIRIPSVEDGTDSSNHVITKIKNFIQNKPDPLSLEILPEGLTVTAIDEANWRHKNLLQRGDRLIMLNGEKTAYMNMKRVKKIMMNPRGVVDLHLERELTINRRTN